ncbi:MAG TPA: aldo/keto reductase [Conexibacter sp.]|nr:aldo/keto reductase [Conexibacter sp.]
MTEIAQTPALALPGGVQIPQLGLGVFQLPRARTVEIVMQALELGYRHVDTAKAYRNEAHVGEAVRASGLDREDVFVTTKLWNSEHSHARRALTESLRQLGLDYVDLYLIHWPAPGRGGYVEAWQALVEAREAGLARAIGVSNFEAHHLQRIVEATGVEPAVNQIELHPRLAQAPLRRVHAERGIVTAAWSPLGRGRTLADATIAAIAEARDRTPAQIALRWHVQLGNVVIPKSASPERLRSNLDVFDFALSDDEMAQIAALDCGARNGPHPDAFDGPDEFEG